MAKLCFTSVFMFVFFIISTALPDNEYLYQVEDGFEPSSYTVALKTLNNEDVQSRRKRNVLVPTDNKNITSAPQTTALPNATEEILITSSKKKSGTVPINTYLTTPKPVPNLIITKNLGVNGTGQRKNISEQLRPPLIHRIATVYVNDNDTSVNDSYIKLPTLPSDLDTPVGEKQFNETIEKHNFTSKLDSHDYYNSSTNNNPEVGRSYWVDLDNKTGVVVNKHLSQSHRRAATVMLKFEFPFYGHLIKNVTIATGGFLYTGDYVHSWLAATQYIAPLMANFDTSLSNDSYIRYFDNGTAFTVEWQRVMLQEEPHSGEFTFQVTLHDTGNIVFVYQNVPVFVEKIEDIQHPVKVGLSDAYIMDQAVFFVRRKTIFEYHRVDFPKEDIKNWTVIYLKALPTCLDSHDCASCLSNNITFKCFWCPTMGKCSDGTDRNRQIWLANSCDSKKFKNASLCALYNETVVTATKQSSNNHHMNLFEESQSSRVYANTLTPNKRNGAVGFSGIMAIIFLVAVVLALSIWVFYAYRNPHTTSGQILIRYRPSQWRWRRGEARYTAATIHM